MSTCSVRLLKCELLYGGCTIRLCGYFISQTVEMPFYAVRAGRKPGLYHTWPECQKQVKDFKYAKYRKFNTESEALQFMNGFDNPGGSSTTPIKSTINQDSRGKTTPYGVSRASFSSSSTSSSTSSYPPESPIKSIDYQLQLTDEEMNLLKEKLTFLQSKKDLLLKEKALEAKKLGLDQGAGNKAKSSINFTSKSPHKELSSGSWSQNKTTKLIDIHATRKLHTGPSSNDSAGGRAVVYTDGSCCGNGKDQARAGIGVYWGDDHPFNVSERLPGRQTNNRAEIFAVVKALQQAKQMELSELVVRTDSQFLISSITEWVPSWLKKNWKTASGKPVVNKDDFLALLKEMKDIKVHWEHVTAHQGIEGNECADKLAVKGAMM